MVLTALLVAAPSAQAQDDGFVSLFDGRTLDGWVNINCAPDTFGVRDGVITVTGVQVMVGVIVMLFAAGLLEGFGRQLITDTMMRYAIGSLMLLFWIAYYYIPRREDVA